MLSARQLESFSRSTGELVRDLLARGLAPITERLAAIEAREPLRGEKGDIGERGEKGDPGEPGERGEKGDKGDSLTVEDVEKQLRSMQSEWALDFERRAQAVLQAAIERIPAPKDGKDGLDGLGFDDLDIASDGRRTFTFSFVRGEQRKEFSYKLPIVLDCGVWKEGNFYEHGDGVTYGGSFWIAQKNTDDKPGTNESWRLAVKKGRDGK